MDLIFLHPPSEAARPGAFHPGDGVACLSLTFSLCRSSSPGPCAAPPSLQAPERLPGLCAPAFGPRLSERGQQERRFTFKGKCKGTRCSCLRCLVEEPRPSEGKWEGTLKP